MLSNLWVPDMRLVPYTVFFRHFKVCWIVQESRLYHRVEGSLLYQNPSSVKSVIILNSFQVFQVSERITG